MMRYLVSLSIVVMLVGVVGAETIQPTKDILQHNADGEYVKIFGPVTFDFDGSGFESPVIYSNGTAKIGMVSK